MTAVSPPDFEEPSSMEQLNSSQYCHGEFVLLNTEQWRVCVVQIRPDCVAEETPPRRQLLPWDGGHTSESAQSRDASQEWSALLAQAPHEWYEKKSRTTNMPKPRPDADDDSWPGAKEYSTSAASGRDPALQGLFSGALGGMVGVPGVRKGQVFYLAPAPEQPPGFPAGRKWPPVFDGVVFCLTAWNPMGIDAPPELNEQANTLLFKDLGKLRDPSPRALWRGFGFTGAGTWREEGFWVSYKEEHTAEGEATILDLASKYRQAAIYVHRAREGRLMRHVLWTGLDPIHDHDEQSPDFVYMRQVPPPRGPLSGRLWLGSGTWDRDHKWEIEEGEEGEFDVIKSADDDSEDGVQAYAFSAWQAEWKRRFECWWLDLPVAGQKQYRACLGALGLHLLGRFDRAWHAMQAVMGNLQPAHPTIEMVPFSLEPGCQWVDERSNFKLPDFPQLPTVHPEFRLPSIPKLLPTWQRLHSLGAMKEQLHALPTPSMSFAQARGHLGQLRESQLLQAQMPQGLSVTTGVGVGAMFAFVLVLIAAHRRRVRVLPVHCRQWS